MSRILRCDKNQPDDKAVSAAVETLQSGGAVVLPTETQYGLALRADQDGTLEKICRLKKRADDLKPALFVKDIKMAESFCIVNNLARMLADQFLPGPLTLVLPPRPEHRVVSGDFLSPRGFGIRISSSPVVSRIMEQVPFPVTATSANVSGRQTPSEISEIKTLFGSEVDLYLDGGPSRAISPSTVVGINGGVTVLRHGQIPEREIYQFLERKKGLE